MGFPDACDLYPGGVVAFGGAHRHDEFAVAPFGDFDLDFGGIGGIDDDIVGLEVKGGCPCHIHPLLDPVDTGVEGTECRYFALTHRIGADLSVAVGLIVGVVVEDRDIGHPGAVEAVECVAAYTAHPKDEYLRFLESLKALFAKEHTAAFKSHCSIQVCNVSISP